MEVLTRTAPQLEVPHSRRVSRRRGDEWSLLPAAAEAPGEPEEDGRTVDELISAWQARRGLMLRAMGVNARSAFRATVRLCGIYPRLNLAEGEPPLLLTRIRGRDGVVRNLITIGGLHRCGGRWTCPWCAFVSAMRRREELEQLTEGWLDDVGGAVAFLTLTMRHGPGDPLAYLWNGLQAAWTGVRKSTVWKHLKQEIGMPGWVRVTELTYGPPETGGNGWHVHMHALLFLDSPLLTQADLRRQRHLRAPVHGEVERERRATADAAADEMSLERVRKRIAEAWASRLTGLGYATPEDRVGRDGKRFQAVDLRMVRSRAGLRSYFDKNAVLDRTWTIADEVGRGATAKHAAAVGGAERYTPLELLRRLTEAPGADASGWFFDLPRAPKDADGRRSDRVTWLTPVGDGRFKLHVSETLPADVVLERVRSEIDERTGEVGSFVEVPWAHRAWFEFQAATRTVPTRGRRPGTRTQTWRQIPAVLGRIRAAINDREVFAARFAWADGDGPDDDVDPVTLERALGGTRIGGFTRLGWERYHLLSPDDQAMLHLAFETSAGRGQRTAERMGIEVRLRPSNELEDVYGGDPAA